jgi:NADH dehydrogenase
VALIGKLRFTGFIAWLMWLGLHLIYLTGFKNRVTALLHWTVSFVGRSRSQRTATEQQIFARAALNRLQNGTADLVSQPRAHDIARKLMATNRRAELEAKAAEETRLTDMGERGTRKQSNTVA